MRQLRKVDVINNHSPPGMALDPSPSAAFG